MGAEGLGLGDQRATASVMEDAMQASLI